MDEAVRRYVDAVDPRHRPLFDRIHAIIVAAYPDATLTLSYGMPTYRVGSRRLYLGAWKHGVSLYGWGEGRDGGFLDRHPGLRTSTGTIRLSPDTAAEVPDDDLRDLVRAALVG